MTFSEEKSITGGRQVKKTKDINTFPEDFSKEES